MVAAADPDSCPFHLQVAGDVVRHQGWIEDLQKEHRDHASNEDGKGHVTRAEYDVLCVSVAEMRTWIIRGAVGVLVAAATGSAFGPSVAKIVPLMLGLK